ncbi:MAG: hypothetical protein COA78_21125 [Blastopirellula sp.]|nr:MAG: hypothetical protein COA78_21125 [Blastopirellula sp.]
MKPVNKLKISFDVQGVKSFLEECDLFGEYTQRSDGDTSPHKEMTDIWVRYKDPKPHIESGDWSEFMGCHESVWLKDIPAIKDLCAGLMGFLNGEKLGGVLITKLPPGGGIAPHVDGGWHAAEYDKYYVPLKNAKGAEFHFDDCFICPEEGDVYAFRNDKNHWVENNSNEDRIAMVVCIKQTKLSKEGLCLGDTQQ